MNKLLLGLAFCLASTVGFADNIVVNPGFEAINQFGEHTGGSLEGWSSNLFLASIFAHTPHGAAETGCTGSSCLLPDGKNAFIGQTLETHPGGEYAMSFWVLADGAVGEFALYWDGRLIADRVLGGGGYNQYVFTGLRATAGQTYFQVNAGTFGTDSFVGFDDFSVRNASEVPEPGSIVLLATGLAGAASCSHNSPVPTYPP